MTNFEMIMCVIKTHKKLEAIVLKAISESRHQKITVAAYCST